MQQKLFLLSIFVFIAVIIFAQSKKNITLKQYAYLALGDSYTIGESVPIFESSPYQTVQLLRKNGYNFNAPEIIAVTGWTTDDLQNGITNTVFQTEYDFVTLLIGVNNQYRGYDTEMYSRHFESLLKQAIAFAGKNPRHVIVLSVPDWGITPFGVKSGRQGISLEIDEYNSINKKISLKHNVSYIDITPGTREAGADPGLLAVDGLHPSGKEYARWAAQISDLILQQLQ
jgi:lysophospholipase L1-like esterase